MLPHWHVISGAAFTALVWVFAPTTPLVYLALVFFSSFLIDIDHYITAVMDTKTLSMREAFKHYEKLTEIDNKNIQKGIYKQGDFHIFHTVEFHLFIFLLGLVFVPFMYILLGMIFHSLLDFIVMVKIDKVYVREFFLMRWLKRTLFS